MSDTMAKTFVFGKAPKSVKDTELDSLFKGKSTVLSAAPAVEPTAHDASDHDAQPSPAGKRAKRSSTKVKTKSAEAEPEAAAQASELASVITDKAPKRRVRSTAKLNDERNERTVFVGNLPSAATVKVRFFIQYNITLPFRCSPSLCPSQCRS